MREIFKRRKSRVIKIREREIGGNFPILVQSMTNTDTKDVPATVEQIKRLVSAGCEIVRVAVPDMNAAKKLGKIVEKSEIPLVADIHFDWRLAMESLEQGVDKLRINPGNLAQKDRLRDIVSLAKKRFVPIRIGVNAGSLKKSIIEKFGGVTPQAVFESAFDEIKALENLDFSDIVISLKCFDVPLMIRAHLLLSEKVDYPFHIGVTEAGTAFSGSIRSSAGIGCLLYEGIGDTIRVSLTADPVEEVNVGYEILKSLGLRNRGPVIISCPTCGRTGINLLKLAGQIEAGLIGKKYDIKVAVMGCVVNGPGEARHADIGVAGGKGEGVIFRNGKIIKKVKEDMIVPELMEEINRLVEGRE